MKAIQSMHRLSGALAIVAVTCLVGWFGYRWYEVGRFSESTDDAYVGGDVTIIAPKVPGFIEHVAITDNQPVKVGDLLVKLDDRDYRATLAKAEANVAAERATLENLDATRELQLAIIAQTRAGVEASGAEIIRARFDQSRYQQLSVSAAASVQTFQKADATYKVALAENDRSRAVQMAAEKQLVVIATRRQQGVAALAGALAEQMTARLNLEYTELRAPIDGVVGNRNARRGAYATIGSSLVTLVPAAGLWIDGNFKENQLAHIRPGAAAIVTVDALPGEKLRGHVISLAPATGAQFSVLPAENATGNFTKIVQRVPVRIALDSDSSRFGRLRPGLSVTVKIDGLTGNGVP
jgi:membrane fusion protein, multidrug efflux system